MKIVHVVECLAGGVLTFLVNLTHQMSEEEHIIIYGIRESTPTHVEILFGNNVQLIRWGKVGREIKFKNDLLALLELINDLKKIDDIDVVHLHSSKAGFLGRIACRLMGKKDRVFYTPHGLSFARMDISQRKRKFYIRLEQLANYFCGDVVACSNSEKKLLVENGIHNVHLISNGIVCDAQNKLSRKISDPLIIGCTGRLTPQKNPFMFNAIAEKFKLDTHVSFLWVGDGELRRNIQKSENLKITGWLSSMEVEKYLDQIDVFLSTSLWEGLPYSVLEAMNMGKPLILSECIGNVDLVENMKNGFLYHNIDEAVGAIDFFLEHPKSVYQMGFQSREKVRAEFSIQQMTVQYRKLYKANNKHNEKLPVTEASYCQSDQNDRHYL